MVWSRENRDDYAKLLQLIAEASALEEWKDGRQYQYWYAGDGFKYWRMTDDVTESQVINRARA